MTYLIQIESTPVSYTKSVKFLGVTVDKNLTWTECITQVWDKVAKI